MWRRYLAYRMIVLLTFNLAYSLSYDLLTVSAQPAFQLSLRAGQLSVWAQQVPLGDLLAKLSHQGQFAITLGEAEAKQLITLNFHDLPLGLGIRRLLQQTNYIVQLAPDHQRHDASQHIVALRILPSLPHERLKHIGLRTHAVASRDALPNDSLPDVATLHDDALAATAPRQRVAALKTIRYHHDLDQGLPILLTALKDDEPQVREVVLGLLSDLKQFDVINAVSQVAERDPSPSLRQAALLWMAEVSPGEAYGVLEKGLNDRSPEVRHLAQRLLKNGNLLPSR